MKAGEITNEQLNAGIVVNVQVSASETTKVLDKDTKDKGAAALDKKDGGGPVGKANKDNVVFCAINYTITKVSLLPGASVRAVKVKCPLPPFSA